MNSIYFLPALLQNYEFWAFVKNHLPETGDLLIKHLGDLTALATSEPINLIPSFVMENDVPNIERMAIKNLGITPSE